MFKHGRKSLSAVAIALTAGGLAACGTGAPSAPKHHGDPPFSINVTAAPYGAQCDGTTDDTTAFTSALAAFPSTGGQLQVPASAHLCKVTSTLQVPANVEIVGESPTASVIWGSFSSGPVLQWGTALGAGAGTTETEGGARDLGIEGNSASNAQSGIACVDCQNLTLERTDVKFVGTAYKFDGGTTGTFSAEEFLLDPRATNVTDGIDVVASGGVVTDMRITGGYIFGNSAAGGYALHASALNTSQIYGASFERFLHGIYFDGTSSNNDDFGTRMENTGTKNGANSFVCSGTGTSNDVFFEPIDADTMAPGVEGTVHNINSSTACDLIS